MTLLNRFFVLALAAMLVATACSGASDGDQSASDDGPAQERIETLWIGPQLVDCVGAFPQTCMEVQYSKDGPVEFFYDEIEGFEHVAGTSYVLTVAVSEVADPPADGSSLRYVLMMEETIALTSADIAGTSWTLLGFRDGELFDPVPDDVDSTLTFEAQGITGSGGCNGYFGSYTVEGNAITFGPIGSTLMACPGGGTDIEIRFLRLLETATTVELGLDGSLVLGQTSGASLVFAPAS